MTYDDLKNKVSQTYVGKFPRITLTPEEMALVADYEVLSGRKVIGRDHAGVAFKGICRDLARDFKAPLHVQEQTVDGEYTFAIVNPY